MNKLIILLLIVITGFAFSTLQKPLEVPEPIYIPESVQRTGDAKKGYEYLVTGDYLKSGVPYDFFSMALGKDNKNFLKREGLNASVSHEFTVVKAQNGENVVAPNCLQCHAQIFDDKLYIGLGNSTIDFSAGQKLDASRMEFLEKMLKKTSPKKYQAAASFITVAKTIGPLISTAVRGVNTADRLAAVLAAHRDPVTFKWISTAQLDIPDEVIPSDVPAWWLLKKKHAMFYNGFGRGDFGKFLMASNLLTVNDTSESKEVDSHFNDVLSYLYSLEPPKFPKTVNKPLAKEGAIVFTKNCSKCHGKYGSPEEYPNLLIQGSVIKTDSLLYKSNYQNPQFVEWFNKSWFSQGEHPAILEPFEGYIAPPLDGVWITAPYLHNGSVPTIEALLNSKIRPTYWQRDFDSLQYDYEKLGWVYAKKDAPLNSTVYNTTLPGYGNYGHYFGDKLTAKERKAVIEYLKTL